MVVGGEGGALLGGDWVVREGPVLLWLVSGW